MPHRLMVGLICMAASVSFAHAQTTPADAPAKPRLLITTDIGGDPDDMQSLRRLLLYSNEFELVGLVASASGTPNEVGQDIVRPDLIQDIIDDYGSVRTNLARHAEGFPTAAALTDLIASGNPKRGPSVIGPGNSTAGSNRIIAAVDATPAGQKTNVAIWGGATDVAQALFDVRNSRGQAELDAFVEKMSVYAIADQDGFNGAEPTGTIIRSNFPDLRYVETAPPGTGRFNAVFRGMYQNESNGIDLVTADVKPLTRRDWVNANVRNDHGALGANYPLVDGGVKEGDTPSWFFFLPNGLNTPDRPDWGGWGGRFMPGENAGHWVDATDDHPNPAAGTAVERKWTVARWREAYQNDFAARMDWSVLDPADANHAPESPIDLQQYFLREVAPGGTLELRADGWTDPDGDTLTYEWFYYREPGTFDGDVTLTQNGAVASLLAPASDEPLQLHVIVAVTDNGSPALTRYSRYVVNVVPEPGAALVLPGVAVAALRRRPSSD